MKIAVAALAAVAFATSANATPTENPFVKDKTVLQLQGLDLSTAEGQQRLAIRMDEAARAVCGDRVATVHIALENQARECRTAVVADIRSRIEARTALNGSVSRTQIALAR